MSKFTKQAKIKDRQAKLWMTVCHHAVNLFHDDFEALTGRLVDEVICDLLTELRNRRMADALGLPSCGKSVSRFTDAVADLANSTLIGQDNLEGPFGSPGTGELPPLRDLLRDGILWHPIHTPADLPPHKQYYLVTCRKDNTIDVMGFHNADVSASYWVQHFSAWADLPEPYRGISGEIHTVSGGLDNYFFEKDLANNPDLMKPKGIDIDRLSKPFEQAKAEYPSLLDAAAESLLDPNRKPRQAKITGLPDPFTKPKDTWMRDNPMPVDMLDWMRSLKTDPTTTTQICDGCGVVRMSNLSAEAYRAWANEHYEHKNSYIHTYKGQPYSPER